MRIEHDLQSSMTDDVIDMVAKTLLLRTGGGQTLISFADLERASETRCEIVKTAGGLIFRTVQDLRN